MKKTLLTFLAALCSLMAVNAQTKRICASQDVYLQQIAQNPAFAKTQMEIEAATQRFINKGGSRFSENTQRGTPVYTIPVVVHVVWKTDAQNISDAQVMSQIDVLNQDFQLLNADSNNVPSVFKPLVADAKVQFCLAKQDPQGNPTTGIVRVQTTKSSFLTNDNVKFTSKGGDDAWDASKYLNLWVCNLSFGVLGYAQFPGGPAATDGVVILYKSFGLSTFTPYNLGRTATHEVGHWLNLRHIWGDDGSACTGSDLVDDTPNQADENYGKPAFPTISCNNGPNGDMFMNYMDYVDDDAMMMFSMGQKDRMWAILQPGGIRASLASSQGCSAPVITCTDVYEPNNTKADAKPIAVNTDVKALVADASDIDIFRFNTIAGTATYTISLTNLPKNYKLQLYNSSAKLLSTSNNSGTTDETIVLSSTQAATFGVVVSGSTATDFDATNCYTLRVSSDNGALKEVPVTQLKTTEAMGSNGISIYPQPSASVTSIRFGNEWKGSAQLTITNSLGKTITTRKINTENRLYQLDVSSFQSGLYYIKISNNATTVTSKFIVQH